MGKFSIRTMRHVKRLAADTCAGCILAGFVFLPACKTQPPEVDAVPAALEIVAPAFSIYAGGELALRTEAVLRNGDRQDVTAAAQWSLRPGSKASISADGIFSAWVDSTGSETVRAFYRGLTAEHAVRITPRATTLALWPVQATVQAGHTLQFQATAVFQDVSLGVVNDQVVWRLVPGLAGEVDATGRFRARAGTAGTETLRVAFQELAAQSVVRVQAQYTPPVELVTIPGGTFTMGDDGGLANERPAHPVTLDSFQIGRYEVTNTAYVEYLNAAFPMGEFFYTDGVIAGRQGPFAGFVYAKIFGSDEFPDQYIFFTETGTGTGVFAVAPGAELLPVVRLSWYGAAAFCAFYGLRLPTEAEWEMACHGGQQLDYGTADGTISNDLANIDGYGGRDRFIGPAPVGSFPPNPYGVFDMSGNVGEYVFDGYDPQYYASSPAMNPHGPGPANLIGQILGGQAIWRGGAWIFPAPFCRATIRFVIADQPDNSRLDASVIGFRVARSLQ